MPLLFLLPPLQIARLARNSFLASFIEEDHRNEYLTAIEVAVVLSAAEEEAEKAAAVATVAALTAAMPIAALAAVVDKAICGTAAVELIAASQDVDCSSVVAIA